MQSDEYRQAQMAMAGLKAAIVSLLERSGEMTNVQIGRTLGIYGGHEGHIGHVPRTLLSLLEQEGVVEQNEATKAWSLRTHSKT